MRRALVTALTAGVAVAPTLSAAAPGAHTTGHRLLPRTVLDRPIVRLHKRERALRAERRRRREAERRARAAATPNVAIAPQLAAISACESGNNPAAIGGGGTYRGAFQFTYAAWQSVGGAGDPAAAPMSEQVYRAALLYERAGPSQWPV